MKPASEGIGWSGGVTERGSAARAGGPLLTELARTPVVDEGVALPQACLGNGPNSQQRTLLRWRACRWRRRSEGKGRFSGPSPFLARVPTD